MGRSVILSTFLFYREKLTPEHLEFIKKAGFDAVEIFSYRAHFDWRNPAYIALISGAFRKIGLRVHSFHAPWDPEIRYDIASLNQKGREKTLTEIFFLVKLLSNMGGKYFIVHPGATEDPGGVSEEYIANSVASLKVMIIYARELGIEVLIENPPPPELGSTAESLGKIFDDLKDYRPNFCFDIGHAFISNDGIDGFLALDKSPLELHISDNHGKSDEHLLPGEAALDLGTTITKLKARFGSEFDRTTYNFEIGRNPGFDKLVGLKNLGQSL